MQAPGLIIGGGIAGLTAAVALQQRGLPVKVCEAAPKILPLGAGIWMAPNAMQVFHRLGLAEKITAAGVPLRNIQIVDGQMQPIVRTNQARVRQTFGYTTTAIRRARLQALLLAELDPADVLLAKTCRSVAQDDHRVTLTFTDGTAHTAGFVIAADGIHSGIRTQLFPSVRFVGTGYVAWRGMSAVPLAPQYKESIMEAWADGVRFGFSEVADGLVDWFAVAKADRAPANGQALKPRLQAVFQKFAYPVPAILAAADETGIIRNEITDFDPIPRWSHGNVCLIGDAAHCCHPVGGQGLNLGIRDAAALAQVILAARDRGEDWGEVRILRRYERWRKLENLTILGFTDLLDRCFSTGWWPLVALRRLGLRVMRQLWPLRFVALRLMTGLGGRHPRLARRKA